MWTYSKYILSSIFYKSLPRGAKRSGGFTFSDLLIAMAVATIMMTVLVIQQRNWDDNLALDTQSYEMAMILRQAQLFSLGVMGSGQITEDKDKFDIGYGLFVDMDALDQYIYFADINKNYKPDSDEIVETKIFTKGVKVDRICGYNNSGDERCYPENGIYKVSIYWFRPNPKAIITFFNPGGDEQSSVSPPTNIYLTSGMGKEISIRVEASGLISIIK